MWIGYTLQSLLFVLPLSSLAESVKTSKACYGSGGCPRYRHTLKCRSGMIAIQDAYYTNSTNCSAVGLSNCNIKINISSIPDTGRYQDFSESNWRELNNTCSTKSTCIYNGVWKSPNVTFSILKYICFKTTGTETADTETADTETGGVAGGVVAAVVGIGAVVTLVFWFKQKRNKTPRVKTDLQDESYVEITAVSKKEVNTNSRSNYDYATINDDIKIRHVGTENYDRARTPVENIMPQTGEAKQMEDEYNHLEDQKQITINGDKPSGYDTTASAAAAVRKLETGSSSNKEDNNDYNHLSDNSDVKPTRSDYDTAASASRAVAQMVKDKDTAEDDYDHFHKKGAKSSDSPYDTTEQCVNETDNSLTGTVDKNDLYDLAK